MGVMLVVCSSPCRCRLRYAVRVNGRTLCVSMMDDRRWSAIRTSGTCASAEALQEHSLCRAAHYTRHTARARITRLARVGAATGPQPGRLARGLLNRGAGRSRSVGPAVGEGGRARSGCHAVARRSGACPLPTVVILHGSHGFAREYAQLAQAWAREGRIAVAPCWFSGGGGTGASFVTPIACPEAPPAGPASSSVAMRSHADGVFNVLRNRGSTTI